MDRKYFNFCLIICFCMINLAMAKSLAYAQDFSATALPEEEGQEAEEDDGEMMMKEEVQQILAQEGIPTYSTTDVIGGDSKYTLGPEDVIQIDVSRHPEVSGDF